jgi:threonine aldolase
VRLHTQAGDEVLLETGAHIFNKEAGAGAALNGVSIRTIAGKRGIFTAADLVAALRLIDVHHCPTTLVCVENTHNVGGGSVWPLETMAELSAAAKSRNLKLHMDGARLWNASAVSGIPESTYADLCDTVAVCFSKSLGAPIGSALAGPADLIARGRRFRKMMGGGMRQAGLLAAGALYALRHHRARLKEDHANARLLADGLAAIRGIEIDAGSVETNIVRFRIPGSNGEAVYAALRERGVLVMVTGADTFRAVLHLQVSNKDVREALGAIRNMVSESIVMGSA